MLLSSRRIEEDRGMATTRADRRLAAILEADVVGYSRLVGRNERETITRLKVLRQKVIEPILGRYGGRTVKLMGDGALVEFGSIVSAVEAGVEIQRAMAEHERDRTEDDSIRFRIGINLGDVIVEGDDILGDGVNVAARLEALAEPGGICISGTVLEHIRDRMAYPFEDLGERTVKNIARPIHVYALGRATLPSLPLTPAGADEKVRPVAQYRLAVAALAVGAILVSGVLLFHSPLPALTANVDVPNSDAKGRASTIDVPALPARLSIVVLPFTTIGADIDQTYFADAITADLTTDLARIDDSFVVAPATAQAYKGKAIGAKSLGRELGVRYVLEGSLRRMGDRVRINVQLIDAATEGAVWADRFEEDWTRTMALQDEITVHLARTLDLVITDAEGRRAEVDWPNKPDAVDLAMRGWSAVNRPITRENLNEARRLFEQALLLDPSYPKALVGLARTLSAMISAHMSDAPAADLQQADEMVTRVLSRFPNNAMAHFIKGEILVTRKDFEGAIREYEAATTNDRSLAPAYGAIGRALVRAGRAEDAFKPLETAIRLSPRDPAMNLWLFSICHAHSHLAQDEATIEWCNRAVALGPYWVAYVDLASAYAWMGREQEAHEVVTKLHELMPGYTVDRWAHESWSDNPTFMAQYQRIVEGLRKAGLPET
jgi:adenylate cyclase